MPDETRVLKTEKIFVRRKESSFDRACDEAYILAAMYFDIDDNGHSSIDDWERSDCHIEVDFVGYQHIGDMTGHIHTYEFEARAVKFIEDFDEDWS